MRTKIVAGNWKMNLEFNEAEELLTGISEQLEAEGLPDVTVVICPPAVYLEMANDFAEDGGFYTGSQNLSDKASGAYTGEISAAMIQSVGADFVIVGHSERRAYFNETDELLKAKVLQAIKHDLVPIFCCGEVLEERNKGSHFDVVKRQLDIALFDLSEEDFGSLVIAYEPVWAIGTGVTASPEQAQEMHAYIRKLVAEKYGLEVAEETTILYGGSCNEKNAAELFSQADVDGGLIGGASLKAESFIGIIKAFN
ncbi:MAG: triose-phosphate isomerase [Bacteroidales bacterium]|nr:triose-phosphate isomerase [Bacteroidales bacterium]